MSRQFSYARWLRSWGFRALVSRVRSFLAISRDAAARGRGNRRPLAHVVGWRIRVLGFRPPVHLPAWSRHSAQPHGTYKKISGGTLEPPKKD